MPEECTTFIRSMKRKYKERRIHREKQWPPCPDLNRKLVRLELVERGKGEVYFANTQRGRKDDSVKHTLAYDDLFKVERGKRPVRKVLVEGDAGIGKTTLCIAVSEDWANGDLFQQFELILHLPLRMKQVASANSLTDLLKLLHSDPNLCDLVARYLEKREGENVLIIADGWDELSESERQHESFLYQLIFGLQYCLMSVVVTSRPTASAPFHKLSDIDKFVVVRGFNKEHIIDYIQSEFPSDQEKAGRLLEQLEGNPLVESVCSVPLNCVIVCHLWRTLEEALPTTMTELYKKIILNVVFRDISRNNPHQSVKSLPNFESLPADLQQSWWCLCKFAFHALVKDEIVFSQKDVEAFFSEGLDDKPSGEKASGNESSSKDDCDDEQRSPRSSISKRIPCFGLLQSSESILGVGYGKSFHFLHLTFQEYLTALHLARQNTDYQCKFFQSHKPFDSLSPYRFEMVRRFFFGINSSNFNEDLSSVIEQCLTCVHGNIYNLSVSHCAFEANSDFVYNDVAKYNIIWDLGTIDFGYPHTAFDRSVILHVIANMKKYSGRLKVRLNYASEDQIKKLLDMKTKLKMIIDLDLDDCRLTVSGLQRLKDAVLCKQLTQLEKLTLERCPISDSEAIISFVTAVKANCLNLSDFWISYIKDSSWSSIVYLERDDIYGNMLSIENLDDEDVTNLIESLCKLNVSLALDCLGMVGIHASGFIYLANAICSGKLKIAEKLHLYSYSLGLEGAIGVGRILSSRNCQLSFIVLDKCQLTTAVGGLQNIDSICCENVGKQLYQMARNTRSTIRELFLDKNSFTREGIHILAGFMYLCPNVEELSTEDCDITSDDLIQLLEKLTQLESSSPSLFSNLGAWYLGNNPLGLAGAVSVGRILGSRNCQLSSITLVNCQLTTAVGGLQTTDNVLVEQLYQMARNTHSTIRELFLDKNSFTGESIHLLAGFMYLCPNVEELSTEDCDITSDDLILLLDKLTQLKSSSPNLCSDLEIWNLRNNQLDDGIGWSVLEQHLPSLFPCCRDLCLPTEMMETVPMLKEKLNGRLLRWLEEYIRKVSCFVYL